MKTTYSPSLRTGEDSLPGKRQETSAGIRRVRRSHSISRRVTEEPCHDPRSGPEPASSSSTKAPLKELDIVPPERSPEKNLAAEESLELQGPVGTKHENNGEKRKNRRLSTEVVRIDLGQKQDKAARKNSPAAGPRPWSAGEKGRTAR